MDLQRKLDNININCKPIKNPLKAHNKAHYEAQKNAYRFFRFWASKTEPKPVGLGRFRFGFGSVFFFSVWLFFMGKNRTEPKMITLTKHIEVRHHFIRDRMLKGDIVLKFVSTEHQLADIFTKSLNKDLFCERRRNLGYIHTNDI